MNFIFDLYGTLLDIRTDEELPRLWRTMADMYRRFGAPYSPGELRQRFLQIERDMRNEAAERLQTRYPEIRLERVFEALLAEKAPGKTPEGGMQPWLFGAANTFRAVSIRRIRLFPGALSLMDSLRDAGHRVFLLSNAQRIFTLPEIRYFGLDTRFDAMYISSDRGFCKPDPRFPEQLIAEQGLKREETVMIGNEPASDMGVAASCRIHGILFNSGRMSGEEIRRQMPEAPAPLSFRAVDSLKEIRPFP